MESDIPVKRTFVTEKGSLLLLDKWYSHSFAKIYFKSYTKLIENSLNFNIKGF